MLRRGYLAYINACHSFEDFAFGFVTFAPSSCLTILFCNYQFSGLYTETKHESL